MDNLPAPAKRPSVALLDAIARARAIGLRPDQIASVTGLTEAQIAEFTASEGFALIVRAQQYANRLPLELLDFDELLDDALAAMGRMLDDPNTPPLIALRIIEEILDRDPTGALAKRKQPARPANRPSAVFDNEAIKRVKERAAEFMQPRNTN